MGEQHARTGIWEMRGSCFSCDPLSFRPGAFVIPGLLDKPILKAGGYCMNTTLALTERVDPLPPPLAPPSPSDARAAGGPSTRSVHAGHTRPFAHHALTVPIVQTATYTFADTADLCTFMDARMWGGARERTEYGRYGNPTVAEVEAKIAALDGAEDALLFASGMAAVTPVLLWFLSRGTHL